MAFPITGILTTKLFVPPHSPKAVPRPRLTERLNDVLCQGQDDGRKLILISAPAGFGKTTLVSEWVDGCARPVAWLSLDEGDSDPARFLTYLVAALQTVAPVIGEEMLRVLQSPQPPALEVMLTVLLNDIVRLAEGIILVLDDYHVIDAQPIDDAITFMIEHLPPQLRLVITTREDPRLPLARLRARGQMIELRASDLRFTSSEAAGFLEAMSLNLRPEDVAALEDRTEGWVAGLQLAALALQGIVLTPGHQDLSTDRSSNGSAFVQAFAGDHHYIVDYLVEEVLQRQPEPVRSFLLQTSILDRLTGSLCDAVTGQDQGQKRLEALERGNFFVIPLDDKRHWYRYHHLFGGVLYARLLAEQPESVPALHRRASEWYERNGLAGEAIRHALAAKDFERAAELIERAVPALRRGRQEATMLSWLRALPTGLFQSRPVLSVHLVGALLSSGKLEGVEDHLLEAERWLVASPTLVEPSGNPPAAMVVADEEEFRRLPGWIAIYRAALALALGNVDGTVKYGRQALGLVAEEDHLGRGAAAGLLGLASWTSGELEAAHRSYYQGMVSLEKAGHFSDAIGCSIALADIRIGQGRLREAMKIYERGLEIATDPEGHTLRGAADMHVGMSELFRERNDLHAARQQLQKSQELGEHNGLPQNAYRWRVALARIQEAQGDLEGALDLLHQAERLYVSDFFPNVRPLAALKAREWAAQGRLEEALVWAREHGLSAQDDLSYLREFEHITLARVLLAHCRRDRDPGSMREAAGLLERLLVAAEAGGRLGSVIEILILQALAHPMQGDLPAALAALERALKLAEPEGYVRIFVDEGPPMAALLEKAALHGIAPDYVRQLQSASGKTEASAPKSLGLDEAEARPAKDNLVEPLSERELEVLRLLGTELNGPEIARELIVSLNTLRTHTKNIYSKLGVNNRLAAVRRAEALELL